MGRFEIELTTRANHVVNALEHFPDVEVATERNLTGETVVWVSVAAPLASKLIHEVATYARERIALVRSQKLKVGKGTIAFEGYPADDVERLLAALAKTDLE